jgi:nucleoside-diphosphate-sugar epimerase
VERVRPERSEVFELVCDNTRAVQAFGWKTEYSLEKGLKETIEWMREYAHLYKHTIYNL